MKKSNSPSTPLLRCRRYSGQPAFLHETLFTGVAAELCAAIDAELLIYVVEMHLDRSFTNEEAFGDLEIAEARRYLLGDLDFSCRQQLNGLVSSRLALKQFFQRSTHRMLLQPELARMHFPHALHDKLGCQLFQHQAAHAQATRVSQFFFVEGRR